MKRLIFVVLAALLLGSHAWADFAAGLRAYDKGDYATALKEWQPLADGGDARAQLRLGLMQAYGKGLKANPQEAEKLFLKAAQGKADLNEADKQGHTALTWAAAKRNPATIEALLAGGADINLGEGEQKTPLMIASDYGSREIVSLLLKKGAAAKKADKEEKTALHFAAARYPDDETLPIMQALLEAGADPNAAGKNGETPLHLAVERKSRERIEWLLSKGAKIDAAEEDGLTPLLALLESSPEEDTLAIAKLLVEKGASFKIADKSKRGPLHFLAEHADEELTLNLLLFFLEKGGDVNAVDDDGRTPLHAAVISGANSDEATALPFIQALLNKGADPNARDESQRTPVFYGLRPDAADKSIPILTALLAGKADVNAADEEGLTLLHLCMEDPNESGSAVLVKFLLDNGARVNALTKEGQTPLHLLAEAQAGPGVAVVGKLLLERKADPNIQDTEFKRTPLHCAADEGNADLVKVLLAAGARTDVPDEFKDTARDLAEQQGHKDVARMIRDSAPGVGFPSSPSGSLDKAGQQKRADELWGYLAKLTDNDGDLIEKAFREIIEKCRESDKVPDALWKLSNFYLNTVDPPAIDKGAEALETLNKDYPQFMAIHPLTRRKEPMTAVQTRLAFCYEQLGKWGKVAELYGPVFAKPEGMEPGEFISYGVLYGNALEKSGKNEEAILVYEKIIKISREMSGMDNLTQMNVDQCKAALARLKSIK